jgi:DNA repair protein RadA/Sms
MLRPTQKTHFLCQDCGHSSPKWNGRCPSCQSWGTLIEFKEESPSASKQYRIPVNTESQISTLDEQPISDGSRISSGLSEFDRVLGGGLVAGSVLLLAGDPGIGKSTILLQVANSLTLQGKKVLYLSGEESGTQVRIRGERLGVDTSKIYFLSETDIETIGPHLSALSPDILIIDSIQTLTSSTSSSTAGSIVQIRECAQIFVNWAKSSGSPTFFTGHVTKEGSIAGPKVLEHMVDVVLSLEGDSFGNLRMIRNSKNRFGSTNDVALFEMTGTGLDQLTDPSAALISERDTSSPGSCIAVALEGSRPILCEIQALTNPSTFNPPRRTITGVDFNRSMMISAVLSRHANVQLGNHDLMVNVPGGLRISETAVDLPIAVAIASSYLDKLVDPSSVIIGEIGLNGETRSASNLETRINEAYRQGYTKVIVPHFNQSKFKLKPPIEILPVSNLRQAITLSTK